MIRFLCAAAAFVLATTVGAAGEHYEKQLGNWSWLLGIATAFAFMALIELRDKV